MADTNMTKGLISELSDWYDKHNIKLTTIDGTALKTVHLTKIPRSVKEEH